MTALEQFLLVFVGGGIGSCARYGLGVFIANRLGSGFPWGTFVINSSGSFVIGLFLTAAVELVEIDPRWRLLVAVGFCGGYTTFSTFAYETAKLLEGRDLAFVLLNTVGSVVCGVLAIFGGAALARQILGGL